MLLLTLSILTILNVIHKKRKRSVLLDIFCTLRKNIETYVFKIIIKKIYTCINEVTMVKQLYYSSVAKGNLNTVKIITNYN